MVNDILQAMLQAVESVGPVARTIIASIAIMLETSVLIGLIVPGDTIVIVAATGVTSVPEGIMLAAAVVAGSLVGESIGYALGHWIGPRIRHSRVGRWIGETNWLRSEMYLERRGGIAIFISRFLPVLHSLVPLTVGMAKYPYRKFIAWTTPACILWAGLYVTVSAFAASSFREIKDSASYAGFILVGVIVAFVLLTVVVKKVLQRSEARHMKIANEADDSV